MAEIYPYNEICVKINNVDEYRRCISMLKGCKKPLYESLDQIIDFLPNYMFIKITSNSIYLSYLTDDNIEYKVDLLNNVLSEEHIDPNIYTINDIKKIEYIINTGLKYNVPEYKSKKIKRLLENIKSGYNYNCIVLSVKNIDEFDFILKYLEDTCNVYTKGVLNIRYQVFEYIENDVLYLRVDEDLKLSFGPLSRIEELSNNFNFTYEKIFDINDIKNGTIYNIINYGNNISINDMYKPKNTKREL